MTIHFIKKEVTVGSGRIDNPTLEFEKLYEEIINTIVKALELYEDISCMYGHPIKFDDMYEKAKRKARHLPINWKAF